ncbi:fimbrial protein [Salmonella enterica]|nr:long polar fimbrial protein LpfA [Salmonella enterica]EBQ4752169.1 long polar fimbrial protein LpfA [Salmonella enterica subsp. diarizonae]EDQ7378495.1 fimbrial protein [Salmonella enterica subsp. diarizonae serovar 35:l,v:z35]EDW4548103.1 fimbrial protein [Salmonella enterica subsp. salamae]HAE6203805.1 fimbrial protein [Salmonella enterica subsp. diarizonae serovar 50:l,v:z35]HCM1913181.1 fimbrial protein [Salmonella enterica subsp. diarizonae serovar 53:k:e,n,x,z15]
MCNKIILAMTAAGMMCATSAFAAGAIATTDAGGGTMTFSGSVIDAPCSIVPDSQNIKVDLGQVSMKSLSAADKYSSSVPVTISLTGCSFEAAPGTPPTDGTTGNYSKVAVTFPGVMPPPGGDLTKGEIANTANSPAANVAIQLLKGDGVNPVDLSKTTPTTGDITLDTSSATNKLNFFARMITVGGAASQGAVGATVTYKLKYF